MVKGTKQCQNNKMEGPLSDSLSKGRRMVNTTKSDASVNNLNPPHHWFKEEEDEGLINKEEEKDEVSMEKSTFQLVPFFNRRLYLSNLPPDTNFHDLHKLFPEANEITLIVSPTTLVQTSKDKETKTGSVQFRSTRVAQDNLRRMVKGIRLRSHYVVVSPTLIPIPLRKLNYYLKMSPEELEKLSRTDSNPNKKPNNDWHLSVPLAVCESVDDDSDESIDCQNQFFNDKKDLSPYLAPETTRKTYCGQEMIVQNDQKLIVSSILRDSFAKAYQKSTGTQQPGGTRKGESDTLLQKLIKQAAQQQQEGLTPTILPKSKSDQNDYKKR